jgi:rubrerythrin
MTHIEGVLKSFCLDETGETIVLTMKGYDNKEYILGISTYELLEKTIKNEKIGIILYDESEDIVSIRGVAKSLEMTAKYSNNF